MIANEWRSETALHQHMRAIMMSRTLRNKQQIQKLNSNSENRQRLHLLPDHAALTVQYSQLNRTPTTTTTTQRQRLACDDKRRCTATSTVRQPNATFPNTRRTLVYLLLEINLFCEIKRPKTMSDEHTVNNVSLLRSEREARKKKRTNRTNRTNR